MKNSFWLLFTVALFSFQCHKDDEEYCTMEFRMITVEINHPDSNFVVDDFYVVRALDNDTIISKSGLNYQEGLYDQPIIIFTSNEFDFTNPEGYDFLFTAYYDGEVIVNERYRINRDRCHVRLMDGKSTINL
ncbi:MAG: hypothetical protein JJU02_00775 [Cryomorphaceae bacterium]|nr:hypothetical protein [Cryomorphaceae bacterium]